MNQLSNEQKTALGKIEEYRNLAIIMKTNSLPCLNQFEELFKQAGMEKELINLKALLGNTISHLFYKASVKAKEKQGFSNRTVHDDFREGNFSSIGFYDVSDKFC